MGRGASSYSDTHKKWGEGGKQHEIGGDETESAPEPHAPSEGKAVSQGSAQGTPEGGRGTKKSEKRNFSERQEVGHLALTLVGRLTVKLRGRPQAPDWSRGCTLSSRTRGDTTAHHGPSNDG